MKKLWNKFSDSFELTILHPQFIMKTHTNSWIKYSPKYLKGNLIDIGCGRMQYKSKIKKYISSYTSLDHPNISKLYKKGEKVDIIADAHKIPVKDKTYDSALMLQVLEYMENPPKVLSEVSRIMKKNSYLILTCPFLYPIHDYPFDRYRFTDIELKDLLQKEKFKVTKIIAQGGFIEFWIQSFLVYWFKTAKNLKFVGILMLVPAPFMIILGNISAILLKRISAISKVDKNFTLNYLVIARKI
jgi:ubiquinone/menaquinone biosynthesis C-methylase UbiE